MRSARPNEPCIGWGPGSPAQRKGHVGGDIDRLIVKYRGISGVRSIFSRRFGKWQQRCGLSPPVLQQLVYFIPATSLQSVALNYRWAWCRRRRWRWAAAGAAPSGSRLMAGCEPDWSWHRAGWRLYHCCRRRRSLLPGTAAASRSSWRPSCSPAANSTDVADNRFMSLAILPSCVYQSCPWVGLTHELSWVGSIFFSFWWVRLGSVGLAPL